MDEWMMRCSENEREYLMEVSEVVRLMCARIWQLAYLVKLAYCNET